MKTELLDLRRMDCMELMKEYPDNHFDLAVVDPPYGIGDKFKGGATGKMNFNEVVNKGWDEKPPNSDYFIELMRVSENQIIWGGNYFLDHLGATRCFITWDKRVGEDFSLAMGELAWTSFDKLAKIFRLSNPKTDRLHPTQKPVKLYDWIFANYAEKGMKILDTHLGSGSSAIASHYAGMHLTACELDEDYYKAACERIKANTQQLALF